jgi:hypothetical protein
MIFGRARLNTFWVFLFDLLYQIVCQVFLELLKTCASNEII